jgi:hypothetical protein
MVRPKVEIATLEVLVPVVRRLCCGWYDQLVVVFPLDCVQVLYKCTARERRKKDEENNFQKIYSHVYFVH